METKQLIDKIKKRKKELGKKLIILTHHYQIKEIIDLGDFSGDSFALSAQAAKDKNAQYIVFCGVHFMAESAAILAKSHQIVQIPDVNAGCWMADMANADLLEKAWTEIISVVKEKKIIPLVYMNSDAHIKAHCGSKNGIICTSSNALKAFKWAFKQGEKIFFFPDEHLGRNTGNALNIPKNEMIVWDPEKPFGGNSKQNIKNAKVILWKGYCLVHTTFQAKEIKDMRKKYPTAKIIVHPECTEDVVGLSDAVGSTSFIVNYVKNAPKGSTIIIGTEINLIKRLELEHNDKTIMPLKNSLCPNMFKINLTNLLHTLENIGKTNIIDIKDTIKKQAKLALDRMLAL
ncbi:MAG: quinolinate synthetase [Desulfobacteraceae bacterium 4572_130]|nr:MAG: quinolinate synthetase [Desulfobacteraceae bacterium 4572_130]